MDETAFGGTMKEDELHVMRGNTGLVGLHTEGYGVAKTRGDLGDKGSFPGIVVVCDRFPGSSPREITSMIRALAKEEAACFVQ